MKSWGLQTRIIAGFVFVAAIVFLVGVIGLYSGGRLSGHITNLGDNVLPSIANLWKVNEAQSAADAAFFAQLSPTISADRKQVELKNLQDALKRIDDGFEAYAKTFRYPEEDRIYKNVTEIWDKWKNSIQEMISLNKQFEQYNVQNPTQRRIELLEEGKGDTEEYQKTKAATAAQRKIYDYIANIERPLFTQATDELGKLIDFNENVGVEAKKTAQSDITFSSVLTIFSILIGTGVAVVFGVYFSNTIAKPLGAKIAGVVGVAEQVAAGDLTKSVPPTEAADEVGRLQNAIRKMIFNLNSFITQVQKSGIQVTTSTTQIAASGKELEATVAEQVASTKQVSSTAQEIATTSRKLVKTMEQVASMAQTTAQSAGSSQKDLSQMENVMRQLAHATTAITDKLGVMNEKANNINNVVTTITKVADQTNLLSLNAAIEAEKAGEYGAGFAVVAREIRRLADQTAVATLEIEQMVKEMQTAVSTGVMEMDKFSKAVNDSVEKVVFIGEQLAQVITQVQGLTPRFEEVSQSMEEQSEGAQQINESMEQLIQASMQTSDALRETNSALGQLDDAAQGLQKEIARFRVV